MITYAKLFTLLWTVYTAYSWLGIMTWLALSNIIIIIIIIITQLYSVQHWRSDLRTNTSF